jgi:hypothetical protein
MENTGDIGLIISPTYIRGSLWLLSLSRRGSFAVVEFPRLICFEKIAFVILKFSSNSCPFPKVPKRNEEATSICILAKISKVKKASYNR